MKPETAGKVKFGVGGFICGAIIAMIIGFGWGGWTTRGTTQKMTGEAVLASQAAICVAQFIKDPNYTEKLKEFEKLEDYGMNNTTDYVRKHGWDKMPGQEKASPYVAEACAEGIEVLIKK
ncbi:MAG: hypothetical protein A2170_05620 [Deltaproteobacteria bacterium RBG_13_53_10]|nr:MAG: hypothetical protein A2170_05620 [Deltaproteobacteria bacterium RBG_13_53_10]